MLDIYYKSLLIAFRTSF